MYFTSDMTLYMIYSMYVYCREDVRSARETGNWKTVQEFYSTTFDSFLELNAAFKVCLTIVFTKTSEIIDLELTFLHDMSRIRVFVPLISLQCCSSSVSMSVHLSVNINLACNFWCIQGTLRSFCMHSPAVLLGMPL